MAYGVSDLPEHVHGFLRKNVSAATLSSGRLAQRFHESVGINGGNAVV